MGARLVRLVHDFGGPTVEAPMTSLGSTFYVTTGIPAVTYRVIRKTGVIQGQGRITRWRVHPDDLAEAKGEKR